MRIEYSWAKRCLVIGVLALVAGSAAAQERIYVSQNSPSEMHGFAFDGAQFAEPAPPVLGGVGYSFSSAVSSRFFLGGASPQGLEMSVVDQITGIELPRVRGTVANEGAILVTGDQHYALAIGTDIAGRPTLSVVDILPSSPSFLREVKALPLLPAPGSSDPVLQNAAFASTGGAALSPDESTLYVSVYGGDLGGDGSVIAVNFSNPLTASVANGARVPGQPGGNVRYGTIGSAPYLFFLGGGNLELIPVSGPSLGSPVTLTSFSPDNGSHRLMTDVSVEDGASPKAFVVADSCADDSCFNATVELLTIDLSGSLADNNSDSCMDGGGNPTHPCVARRFVLNAGGAEPFNNNLVRRSLDARFLYVLSETADAFFWCPSELFAFDVASLDAGSPNPLLAETPVDVLSACPPDLNSTDFVGWGVGFDVQNAVAAPGSSVSITDAASEAGKVFTNDVAHTLTVSGSNLNRVVQAYLGRTPLTNLAASNSTLTATIPARVPSGNPTLLLADSSGGLTPLAGQLTVNDPPQFLPKSVVYATGGGCDRYAQINSATGSEVASTFPTITQGPLFARVTKDGNYLLTAGFNDGRLTVHSLLDHNGYGWNRPVETLYAGGDDLLIEHMVQNPAPGRHTVYINNLADAIYMLDPTALPPALIDADGDNSTTDSGMPHGVTGIPLPVSGYRSIAVSSDGNWLYAGSRAPAIVRVDVSSDHVTGANVTTYPIPGLASGRMDGLALSADGTRIFVGSVGDSVIRAFSRNPADGSVDTSSYVSISPGATDPWVRGDVRVLLAPPDGRFLYVTSRSEQRLDIFDVSDLSNIAHVSKISLPLGGFFMDVTPRDPNGTNTNDYVFVAASENDSVTAIYEGPTTSTLTQHQILTVTGGPCNTVGIAVSPGAETGSGTGVVVSPTQASTVTYSDVTAAGNTTVTSSNSSSLTTPPNFELAGSTPVYYDVSTTAAFSGPVTVCFQYVDTGMAPAEESALRLLHESGGTFVDVTTSLDTAANKLCGSVSGFSQFVIAQRAVAVSIEAKDLRIKGNAPLDITILSSPGFDATKVDPSTIVLLPRGEVSTIQPGAAISGSKDENKDRLPDLTVSISRKNLNVHGSAHSSGTVYLQGRLFDGTAFAGQAELTLK